MADTPAFEQFSPQVQGRPRVITSVETYGHLMDRIKAGMVTGWMDIRCWTEALQTVPHAYNWPMFSATGALAWAAHEGAERIEVWGADWSGTLDYDGTAAGKNRSDSRWVLERQIWTNCCTFLREKRGIEVIRHVAQNPDGR